MSNNATIMPCLRYQDAKAAMEFLSKAFNFKKHVAYEEKGQIVHAQMTYGNGMVMLSSAGFESEYGKQVKQPSEIGGFQTQAPFVLVEDVDAHYAQAVKAGVRVVLELKTEPHGKGYSCLDLEGFLWSFGDYNPWVSNV